MKPFHLLIMLFAIAIWGINFVAIKLALQGVTPIELCAARFLLATFPALFFVKRPQTSLKVLFSYGLIMFALQFTLLFAGMDAGISAGLASLLLQTNVFFTLILAVFLLKEKLTRWQLTGASIAFSGIGLVWINLSGKISPLGFMLVIAAAFCWAIGNLLSKQVKGGGLLSLVVWGSAIAVGPLCLLVYLTEGMSAIKDAVTHLSWVSFLAISFIAYPSTLLGFGIWNFMIRKYSVSTVSPFTLLVPVFGMLSSALILHESLPLWKIIAAFLVISGLCINSIIPRFFEDKSLPQTQVD